VALMRLAMAGIVQAPGGRSKIEAAGLTR